MLRAQAKKQGRELLLLAHARLDVLLISAASGSQGILCGHVLRALGSPAVNCQAMQVKGFLSLFHGLVELMLLRLRCFSGWPDPGSCRRAARLGGCSNLLSLQQLLGATSPRSGLIRFTEDSGLETRGNREQSYLRRVVLSVFAWLQPQPLMMLCRCEAATFAARVIGAGTMDLHRDVALAHFAKRSIHRTRGLRAQRTWYPCPSLTALCAASLSSHLSVGPVSTRDVCRTAAVFASSAAAVPASMECHGYRAHAA